MASQALVGDTTSPVGTADVLVATGLVRNVQGRFLGPFNARVAPGELVALVGPNGSGKTTMLRLALGIDRAARGTSVIAGRRVDPLRPPRGVGYVPDRAEFWDWLTGRENLAPFAAPDASVDELLATVGLAEAADVRVRRYSRGMRQRLAIARALAPRPALLVLDEPTIALDTEGVDMLVGILTTRAENRRSGLVATHDADFLARMPARVVRVENARTP